MWDKIKKKLKPEKQEETIEEIGGFAINPGGPLYPANSGASNPRQLGARRNRDWPQLRDQYNPNNPQNIPGGIQHKDIHQRNTVRQSMGTRAQHIGFKHSGCDERSMHQWQTEVINNLKTRDQYVIAPPGGGKTTPVLCYWKKYILFGNDGQSFLDKAIEIIERYHQENSRQPGVQINLSVDESNIMFDFITRIYSLLTIEGPQVTRSDVISIKPGGRNGPDRLDIPKLVYAVPVKTLGLENFNNMVSFFTDIILTGLDFLCLNTVEALGGPRIPPLIDQMKNYLRNEFSIRIGSLQYNENIIRKKVNNAVCLQMGGTSEGGGPESALVVIMTYQKLENEIKRVKNIGLIIFDEAHQAQPTDSNKIYDQQNSTRHAGNIISILDVITSQRNLRLAFLSGTISKESAKNLTNFIKYIYNRDIGVYAAIQSTAKNPTKIRVVADDSLRDMKSICNMIIDMVKRKDWGNAFIFFSKKMIDDVIEECQKKLPQLATIRDKNRDDIYDNPNKNSLISGPGAYINRRRTSYGGGSISFKKPGATRDSRIEKILNTGGQTIENEKVRNAVAHGIGFIYREEGISRRRGEAEYKDTDKLLVADLFSKKVLPVLLSTDAIGIGVNVNIRKMYIPSLSKLNKLQSGKTEFSDMPFINLSQLINRTGRGISTLGIIYTPTEFVDSVQKAINVELSQFDNVEAIVDYKKMDFLKKSKFKNFLIYITRAER